MSKFKYRAMNSTGEKINGDYEANSRDDVISMLSANGLYPLMVEEVIESTNIEISIFDKVKTKDISIFCRQFYTMLDAGVTMNNALNILSKQLTNKKLKLAITEIEDDVKKGEMLSASMKKYDDIFPQFLVSMVESGEISGKLDEVMLRMSIHYEKENKINNKVKSAMIYPSVLSVVAVAAVIVIMTFVMPTFLEMFAETGTELPLITKVLISISSFMNKRWYIILLIVICFIVGFTYFKRTEFGQISLSKIKLKIPVVKNMNQMIIVSRFTRTLSTLLASGVSLTQSLDIIADIVGNKIAEEEVHNVRDRVFRGEGMYLPIKDSEVFPEMLASMVKIGEETGSLDGILEKTADFYDDELEQAIQTTVALVEPALIVVMGLVIGTIVLAIMIPMFTMYGNM